MADAGRLQVLYVCTGNICRSPMAERLLIARAGAEAGIDVVSAGTYAVVGSGMDEAAAFVTRELGADSADHVAQEVDRALLQSAGLILTATVAHRSHVLAMAPSLMHRTFTMREFVRLGADVYELADQPDGIRGRIAAIARRRGPGWPVGAGVDDIADPYGAALSVMQACGDEVVRTVEETVRILGLARAG